MARIRETDVSGAPPASDIEIELPKRARGLSWGAIIAIAIVAAALAAFAYNRGLFA